ncbi:MAG: hypothetical protein HZA93_26145 [Verrucomicrobia bacterium]|nr:hypothetical protein [Verrucomicrobiota bacterium]
MNRTRGLHFIVASVAGLLAFILGGCANVFTPKVKVLIDAISVAGGDKPAGKSYKLVARKSVVSSLAQVNIGVVSACVKAALNQKGMYEAPEKVAPDYFVEVIFGTDTAARIDPLTRESFLQLSARANPERLVERGRGPEIWDVRAALQGLQGRFETALPLLSTMAATYAGTDTHVEVPVHVQQNAPDVLAVRDAAVKELDAKKMIEPSAPAPGR